MKELIKLGIITVLSFSCFYLTASAETAYYKNSNNVEMNETQYNKMLQVFSEEMVSVLTQEQFDKYKDCNVLDSATRFEKIISNENETVSSEEITEEQFQKELLEESQTPSRNSSDSESYETSYKKLTASIVELDGQFYLNADLDWKKVPARRSYDVFAFYLNNLHHNNFSGVQYYYTTTGMNIINYNTNSAGYKSFSNGAGVSMNLKDGTNITDYLLGIASVLNKTTTNAYGRAYVSYQHCKSDITRAQSKSYILSLSGLGNVVYYSDNWLMNTYDGMGGVSLRVDI